MSVFEASSLECIGLRNETLLRNQFVKLREELPKDHVWALYTLYKHQFFRVLQFFKKHDSVAKLSWKIKGWVEHPPKSQVWSSFFSSSAVWISDLVPTNKFSAALFSKYNHNYSPQEPLFTNSSKIVWRGFHDFPSARVLILTPLCTHFFSLYELDLCSYWLPLVGLRKQNWIVHVAHLSFLHRGHVKKGPLK